MKNLLVLGLAMACGLAVGTAKPADLRTQTNEIQPVSIHNPFSLGFKWTKYNIAAVTTAGLVIVAAVTLLTTLFFPVFIYKVCYALGGCQNTMDHYVDQLLGVNGHEILRKRSRRSLSEMSRLEYVFNLFRRAMQEYENDVGERDKRGNIMIIPTSPQPPNNHQIGKRSPIDYIEPILIMVSKAYNEYVDPELKKNFKKPPFIR
ncbi:uncharacterized protein [Euwallacea fornicatus]|uniref:uncharacterized protein n=1 Tax=Euwallacea fornicatus TaxID=995702 RepID=UPI0033906092